MASESENKPLKTIKDRLFSLAGSSDTRKGGKGLPPKAHFSIWYFVLAILFFSYLQPMLFSSKVETISYSQFKQYLSDGKLEKLSIGPDHITGKLFGVPDREISTVRVDDPGLVKELDESKVNYAGQYRSKFLGAILSWVLPLGIFFLIWRFAMRKMGPGMGVMSFSKSKAKIFAESDTNVTFEDVAGIDEAKEELEEVVEFLSTPEKSQKLGGRIPKGVLLVGAPGTGKTLMAQAIAGEAEVPFSSISGSEFVEMFVGVGASRVRDLFQQAKKQSPCIVFIDELDAVGGSSG